MSNTNKSASAQQLPIFQHNIEMGETNLKETKQQQHPLRKDTFDSNNHLSLHPRRISHKVILGRESVGVGGGIHQNSGKTHHAISSDKRKGSSQMSSGGGYETVSNAGSCISRVQTKQLATVQKFLAGNLNPAQLNQFDKGQQQSVEREIVDRSVGTGADDDSLEFAMNSSVNQSEFERKVKEAKEKARDMNTQRKTVISHSKEQAKSLLKFKTQRQSAMNTNVALATRETSKGKMNDLIKAQQAAAGNYLSSDKKMAIQLKKISLHLFGDTTKKIHKEQIYERVLVDSIKEDVGFDLHIQEFAENRKPVTVDIGAQAVLKTASPQKSKISSHKTPKNKQQSAFMKSQLYSDLNKEYPTETDVRELVSIVKNLDIFQQQRRYDRLSYTLQRKDLIDMCKNVKLIRVPCFRPICRQNQDSENLYFIMEGSVIISMLNEDENDKLKKFKGKKADPSKNEVLKNLKTTVQVNKILTNIEKEVKQQNQEMMSSMTPKSYCSRKSGVSHRNRKSHSAAHLNKATRGGQIFITQPIYGGKQRRQILGMKKVRHPVYSHVDELHQMLDGLLGEQTRKKRDDEKRNLPIQVAMDHTDPSAVSKLYENFKEQCKVQMEQNQRQSEEYKNLDRVVKNSNSKFFQDFTSNLLNFESQQPKFRERSASRSRRGSKAKAYTTKIKEVQIIPPVPEDIREGQKSSTPNLAALQKKASSPKNFRSKIMLNDDDPFAKQQTELFVGEPKSHESSPSHRVQFKNFGHASNDPNSSIKLKKTVILPDSPDKLPNPTLEKQGSQVRRYSEKQLITPEIQTEFMNNRNKDESVQSHAELQTNIEGLLLKQTSLIDDSLPVINIAESNNRSGSSSDQESDSGAKSRTSVTVSTNSVISLQDCEVKENGKGESQEWEIVKLSAGQYFGVNAFEELEERDRQKTKVTAYSASKYCHLLVFPRDLYREIVKAHLQRNQMEKVDFFKSSEIFRNFAPKVMKKMANQMELKILQRNQLLFQEGQKLQYIYFVKRGEIQTSKRVLIKADSVKGFDSNQAAQVSLKSPKIVLGQKTTTNGFFKIKQPGSHKTPQDQFKAIQLSNVIQKGHLGDEDFTEGPEECLHQTSAQIISQTCHVYVLPLHDFVQLGCKLQNWQTILDLIQRKRIAIQKRISWRNTAQLHLSTNLSLAQKQKLQEKFESKRSEMPTMLQMIYSDTNFHQSAAKTQQLAHNLDEAEQLLSTRAVTAREMTELGTNSVHSPHSRTKTQTTHNVESDKKSVAPNQYNLPKQKGFHIQSALDFQHPKSRQFLERRKSELPQQRTEPAQQIPLTSRFFTARNSQPSLAKTEMKVNFQETESQKQDLKTIRSELFGNIDFREEDNFDKIRSQKQNQFSTVQSSQLTSKRGSLKHTVSNPIIKQLKTNVDIVDAEIETPKTKQEPQLVIGEFMRVVPTQLTYAYSKEQIKKLKFSQRNKKQKYIGPQGLASDILDLRSNVLDSLKNTNWHPRLNEKQLEKGGKVELTKEVKDFKVENKIRTRDLKSIRAESNVLALDQQLMASRKKKRMQAQKAKDSHNMVFITMQERAESERAARLLQRAKIQTQLGHHMGSGGSEARIAKQSYNGGIRAKDNVVENLSAITTKVSRQYLGQSQVLQGISEHRTKQKHPLFFTAGCQGSAFQSGLVSVGRHKMAESSRSRSQAVLPNGSNSHKPANFLQQQAKGGGLRSHARVNSLNFQKRLLS